MRPRSKRKPKQHASGAVQVGRLKVDLAAISQLAHRCTPEGCGLRCCCSSYEVHVNAAELSRIVGLLPKAARYCPHLKTRDGLDNIFEDLGRGIYALDTDDDGRCLFAYQRGRSLRCSLHTVAEECGLSPYQVKPYECSLWPLALTTSGGRTLTVDDTAYTFPCSAHQPVGSPLSPSIASTIESLFGRVVLRNILDAIDNPG